MYPIGGPEIFTFRGIGELAAQLIGDPAAPRVRAVPIDAIRLFAFLASAIGRVSRTSRRTEALVRWMIYPGTHDAIAPSCGQRRLRDDFAAKAAVAAGTLGSPSNH